MTENNAFPARTPSSAELYGAPSPTQTQDEFFQVAVDEWGHNREFHRGQIVRRSDIDSRLYDVDHAILRGIFRPLTEAEARSQPSTAMDEDHAQLTRLYSGIPTEQPRTIDLTPSQPEPAELSKPTRPEVQP